MTPVYPFVPKSNTDLAPGQFWSIPLSDGRFGCGRVLRIDRDRAYGARVLFVGAVLDWAGETPPTSEAIAGAGVLAVGTTHVRTIAYGGGTVLGMRPLEADGITVPSVLNTHWGSAYPTERVERRFILGDPPATTDFRQVASPLTDDMLRPSPTGRGVVQFNSLLADGDFIRLAEWMCEYPEMTLRAYGSYDQTIRDLEFLRFFPSLHRFDADALHASITSIDGLRHLPADLEELALGDTTPRHDLSLIGRFPHLRSLWVEGHKRGIEAIGELRELERLSIRSITLPDLSLFLPLRSLQSLEIKLGGTTDLRLLPELGPIRYLELWLIRGLDDIDAIGRMGSLRYVFLQALKRVERLPDFGGAPNLRRIHLQTMKGLSDLSPFATARALEDLVLIDMPQLGLDDLQPLLDVPGLRGVSFGLGSVRRNEAAAELLGLPAASRTFDWRTG